MTIQRFRRLFGDEERCWEHLRRLRWPRGFVCLRCGGASRGYMRARRVDECRACGYQGSVTAGTIFHKARVPLQDWFWAIYRMSQGKKGVSALQLGKEIGVSYPTAWLMAHKIRKAMADREQGRQLRGLIEVDEGYVGGKERGGGRIGRSAQTKSIVAVAVEHWKPGDAGAAADSEPRRSDGDAGRDLGQRAGLYREPDQTAQRPPDRCLRQLRWVELARLSARRHPAGR